ncbi:conserved Plasmodium protein, unknown function [Plasmodium gaboni]|uniref:Uncharacterized protein n=1 Tax=Plasmodium gaboni TaxID=647221 RepID=A0ABY1UMK7_9APIC|nr:conserved Plasmodium protein, unknown function [Plasmodium gaboni]
MAKISSWIKKQRGFDKEKIKENYKNEEYVDIDIFSISNKSGDSSTENNSDCNSIIEENTINIEDISKKGDNKMKSNKYNKENENKNNNEHHESEKCSIHKNKYNQSYKCILNIFEDNEQLGNQNKIESNINKQIIAYNKRNIKNNINNILLSKKSHIFHSIKILVPSIGEKDMLNDKCVDKYVDIKQVEEEEEEEEENIKKEVEEKNINNNINIDINMNDNNYCNCINYNMDNLDGYSISKNLFEHIYSDTSPNKKLINDNIHIEEDYYERDRTSTNYNNILNIYKDDKNKTQKKIENALNNIYINFDVYENKMKKIDRRKKKKKKKKNDINVNANVNVKDMIKYTNNNDIKNDKYYDSNKDEINILIKDIINKKKDILYVKNKLIKDISRIETNLFMSDFYNDICGCINNLNNMKIKKAFFILQDLFIKKYSCNKRKRKLFLRNIFISEILYRYKIIRKTEIIFNMNNETFCDNYMKYSVISKRLYKNYTFDYIIDLIDVNGKICFMKYISCLNKINHYFKNIKLKSIDILNSSFLENNFSSFESVHSMSSQEFSEDEKEKKKYIYSKNNRKNKSKNKKKIKKNKKTKKSHSICDKCISNVYIDFSHFNLAYEDEDNEVFYYVTKKEYTLLKRSSSSHSYYINKEEMKEEKKKKVVHVEDINITHINIEHEPIKVDHTKYYEEEQYKEINKNKNKKNLLYTNKKSHSIEQNEHNMSLEKCDEKSDFNTVIYFYVNLLIPSNFIYIIASLIETTLFKSWIPFYSFPFKFGITDCKLLKERGLIDKMVYTKIAMPWIIRDRYLLMDVWICEDFEYSKGIFLYATNFPRNSEINNNVSFDTDNCIEIDMSIHAFICPKCSEQTYVKCYVEISPNMNFNEFFISFITKVFIKSCITHFIKVCKEFEINEEYNKELQKNIFFYDKLRKAAKENKIY